MVHNGETITPRAGACYTLEFGSGSESTFNIDTTGVSHVAIFAEHDLHAEFESTASGHYLTTAAGVDVEPECDGEVDHSGHDHGRRLAACPKHSESDGASKPAVALALGAAGAVPFVGLTPGGAKVLGELVPPGAPGGSVVAWATSRERRVPLQVSYGASILSFLGAVHWGLAMAGGVRHGALRFAWSVVPSLVAWPCAALPPCVGLQVSAGGLLAAAAVDLALFRTCSSLPAWYVAGLRVGVVQRRAPGVQSAAGVGWEWGWGSRKRSARGGRCGG